MTPRTSGGVLLEDLLLLDNVYHGQCGLLDPGTSHMDLSQVNCELYVLSTFPGGQDIHNINRLTVKHTFSDTPFYHPFFTIFGTHKV